MEKVNVEESYIYQNYGIRNDYLYQILFYPVIDEEGRPRYGAKRKCIIGEILNFNCNQFFIKSYDDDEGNNHYILKLDNIIGIQPYASIKEFNEEIINQQFKKLQGYASLYIKDSNVLKYRSGNKYTIKLQDILKEITNKNRVIVEENGILTCYFKDEDKHIIKESSRYQELKDRIIFSEEMKDISVKQEDSDDWLVDI